MVTRLQERVPRRPQHLLIVAILTKSSRAIIWAGVILGLVALQVTFGLLGHEITSLALLHGLNAILLAGTSLAAGLLVFRGAATEPSSPATVKAKAA